MRAADLVVDYVNGFALAEASGTLGQPEDRRGLLELLETEAGESVPAMSRVFGALAEEELLAVADAYVRFYREHPGHFRLFVFPPSDGPSPESMPALAELIAARIEAETERLAGAIGRVIDSGVAREVDARRAATFLWGAWNGVIAMHLRSGRPALADGELESVFEQGRLMITVGMLADPRQ